jgi:hypothetical protein
MLATPNPTIRSVVVAKRLAKRFDPLHFFVFNTPDEFPKIVTFAGIDVALEHSLRI